MGPAGFIAVLAGWFTTEVGRQPFTVYGLLRTADSASPLAAPAVGSSLIAFVIVYFIVYAAGLTYMFRLMAQPPHPGEQGPSGDMPAHAAGITPAAGVAGRRSRLMIGQHRPRDHLGVHHRLRGVRLCGDGRIRSRPRHPVSAVSRQGRSRRDHEQRRAGLGRQRDLAGARRRRPDGGVSAGLCGADAGAVHADDCDADRPRSSAASPSNFAGGRRRASAIAGIIASPADRCWQRWRRELRSALSCRASMSRGGIMPAAGGTG